MLDGENAALAAMNDGAVEAVFPIFAKVGGKDRIIGTGFYITQDIFVTAKHVIEEYVCDGRLLQTIGTMHMSENGCTFRSLQRATMADDHDLLIGVLQPM